jgi:NAD(P)-dependent dehydrogenase (short-subunit alcohol dehydrogenase family)
VEGRLRNKVILVSGAAQGLGEACAERFAREGARLALIDVNADGLEGTRSGLEASGADVIAVAGDVSSAAGVEAFVAAAKEAHGRIDGVANVAGIIASAPLADHAEETWDHVFAVNVKSQFLMSKAVAPALRAAGGGSIVNVSSTYWEFGLAAMPGYCSSKAAITGLTKSLAVELGPDNVRVNAITPGSIEGPMNMKAQEHLPPEEREAAFQGLLAKQIIKRMAAPAEIANLILFLLSDEGSYMTGSVVAIDGGRSAG